MADCESVTVFETFTVKTTPRTSFKRGIEVVDGLYEGERRRFINFGAVGIEGAVRDFGTLLDPTDELAMVLSKEDPPDVYGHKLVKFALSDVVLQSSARPYLPRLVVEVFHHDFGHQTANAALLKFIDMSSRAAAVGSANLTVPQESGAKVLARLTSQYDFRPAGVSMVLLPENHSVVVHHNNTLPAQPATHEALRYLPKDSEKGLIVEPFLAEPGSETQGTSGDPEPRTPKQPPRCLLVDLELIPEEIDPDLGLVDVGRRQLELAMA